MLKKLVPALGKDSSGSRNVESASSAEPALSDRPGMRLGCVQAVKLAPILQPLRQGARGCSPSFSGLYKEDERLGEAQNNRAARKHRRGLFDVCARLWGR